MPLFKYAILFYVNTQCAHLHDILLISEILSSTTGCLLHPIVAVEALFNHPDSAERFFWAFNRLRGHYLEMRERKWSMGF